MGAARAGIALSNRVAGGARRPWLQVLLVLLAGLVIAAASWFPPLPQAVAYHAFADQRACGLLPNCLDTASNLLFVLAGSLGLGFLHRARGRPLFIDSREAVPYRLFFAGVILVGFGSGYYHLAPDHAGLLWDRLAMILAFTAWFAAIVCERVDPRTGLRLLPLLLAAGLGSVAWWGWTEARAIGDLRPYLVMKVLPMLMIPMLLWAYRPRYTRGWMIVAVIVLYGVALLFDRMDRPVFELTGGQVSGHTIKHVVAAIAALLVAYYLHRRSPGNVIGHEARS